MNPHVTHNSSLTWLYIWGIHAFLPLDVIITRTAHRVQTHLLASISLLKGDGQSDEISRLRHGRVWSTVSPVTFPEHGRVRQPGHTLNPVLKGFLWQHDQSLSPFPAPLLSGEWRRGGGAGSSWFTTLCGEQLPSRGAPWLISLAQKTLLYLKNYVRNRGQRPYVKTKDMPNALNT